jgi:hypothetical protein
MSTLQLGANVTISGSHGTGANSTYGSISGIVSAEGIIPTGSVIYTATSSGGTSTLPFGYLRCDGTALPQSEYPELWAAIGPAFNSGVVGGFPGAGIQFPNTLNPATQFRVPYLQGTFIRCWDGPIKGGLDERTSINDPNRVFGSYQADEFKSHFHNDPTYNGSNGSFEVPTGTYGYDYGSQSAPTGLTGGLETRPRNIALMAIIKY